MATERTSHPRDGQEQSEHMASTHSGTSVLPSQRIARPPAAGTDDAAFLANLNEVYGAEGPEDAQVIEGIRHHLRTILDETR